MNIAQSEEEAKKIKNRIFFLGCEKQKKSEGSTLEEEKISPILKKLKFEQKGIYVNHTRWRPMIGSHYSKNFCNFVNVNYYGGPSFVFSLDCSLLIVEVYVATYTKSCRYTNDPASLELSQEFFDEYDKFIYQFTQHLLQDSDFKLLVIGKKGEWLEAKTIVELIESNLREYLKKKKIVERFCKGILNGSNVSSSAENKKSEKLSKKGLKHILKILDNYCDDYEEESKKDAEAIFKELLDYSTLLNLFNLIEDDWEEGDVGKEFKIAYEELKNKDRKFEGKKAKNIFKDDYNKINRIRNKIAHLREEISHEELKDIKEIYERLEKIMKPTLEKNI